MLTTLTEQDVRDAHYAHMINLTAKTEETNAENLIREFANTHAEYTHDLAMYQRGVVLLRDYAVMSSDRSVVGGRFSDKEVDRIVSPIVQMSSGHIATSEAYRAVALRQR